MYAIALGIGTVCSTPWSLRISLSAVHPWKVRNAEHMVEPGYCLASVRYAASQGSYAAKSPSNRCRKCCW